MSKQFNDRGTLPPTGSLRMRMRILRMRRRMVTMMMMMMMMMRRRRRRINDFHNSTLPHFHTY
jgi:hypothetical protein